MIPNHEYKLIVQQLKKFKYPNLRSYLASSAWGAKKQEKRERTRKKDLNRCQLCGESNILLDLHHRTYQRLGEERLEDLVWCCRSCHNVIHDPRNFHCSDRKLNRVTSSIARRFKRNGLYDANTTEERVVSQDEKDTKARDIFEMEQLAIS